MPGYLVSFLVALAASLGLTPLVRRVARQRGLVAQPRPDRWHRKPTSLMGGVGIYVAFVLAYLLFRDRSVQGGGLLVTCASAMFLLGLIDDLVHLKPYAKLVGQIAPAAALTTWSLHLPWTHSTVLNGALTIFWLVGVTNAMNLLDNIDGLAAGIAVIAAGFMTYFFLASGQQATAAITAGFAGAVLGFVVYNFNPASIFMGDSGSLFIGFFLGAAALLHTTQRSRGLLAVLAPPVLILAIPILDTSLVTVLRKLNGRKVSQGGRDHTSHRLVALGLTERAATLTLYAMAIASGLTGVAAFHFPTRVSLGLLPVFTMALLFVAVYLGRVKVYRTADNDAVTTKKALLPTLADFTYKRRIFEVLNDFVLIVVAYYGAFLLRFESQLVEPYWSRFMESMPLVIVVQIGVFLAAGLYDGLWRYTSIKDLRRFITACALASLATVAAVAIVFRGFAGFSRAVLMLDGLLLFLAIAGSRVSFRLFRDWMIERMSHTNGRRVLIYGAGDAGELLLREIRNNESLGLIAVGFVDDDPSKIGRVIHGVRVVASFAELGRVLPDLHVEEVVVSSHKLDAGRLAAVSELCRERAVSCRRARFQLE